MQGFAIIAGASQGIGKSTAEYFLANDWSVINISRHNSSLPKIINYNIDLSTPDWHQSHAKKLAEIIQDTQKICLVHNAFSYYSDTIYNFNDAQFNQLLNISISAPLLLNQIFLPKMTTGSSIIYIGSTLSEKAVAGAASYIIAKHAVVGMMRATCQDLNRPDVHTCCICPGFTETEMMKTHLNRNPKLSESIKDRVATKRLIQPAEIASLIYYCANNPVINGSVIHANLGQLEQ